MITAVVPRTSIRTCGSIEGMTLTRLVRPPRLRDGDTIGVVSLSAPISSAGDEGLEQGVAVLESWGFRVRLGDRLRDRHAYAAGRREDRLAELHATWADDDVAMVLMSQGGHSANQLLDGLDHSLFRRKPTIFMGMSDGTALLSAIGSRAGVVTFHGPDLVWGLGRPMSASAVQSFLDVLGGRAGLVPYAEPRVLRSGRAAGPLWGGHLTTLAMTMLAGHAPDLTGAVLFLEGTGSASQTDRLLTALRLAGVFERIAGLVVGHFEGHDDGPYARPVAETVLEVTGQWDFPVLEVDELGHGVDNLILPVGVRATLDTDVGLTLDGPGVA